MAVTMEFQAFCRMILSGYMSGQSITSVTEHSYSNMLWHTAKAERLKRLEQGWKIARKWTFIYAMLPFGTKGRTTLWVYKYLTN